MAFHFFVRVDSAQRGQIDVTWNDKGVLPGAHSPFFQGTACAPNIAVVAHSHGVVGVDGHQLTGRVGVVAPKCGPSRPGLLQIPEIDLDAVSLNRARIRFVKRIENFQCVRHHKCDVRGWQVEMAQRMQVASCPCLGCAVCPKQVLPPTLLCGGGVGLGQGFTHGKPTQIQDDGCATYRHETKVFVNARVESNPSKDVPIRG